MIVPESLPAIKFYNPEGYFPFQENVPTLYIWDEFKFYRAKLHSTHTYAYYKYTHKLQSTQALKEEIVPCTSVLSIEPLSGIYDGEKTMRTALLSEDHVRM